MADIYGSEPPLDCSLCPRLVDYRVENAAHEPKWFNAPVPSFGDPNAELLIVGLAPGRMGANKTGRPFTGDFAGDLLYATLDRFGLSLGNYGSHAGDGLELRNCMITNAVRCVPPENKPTTDEISTCRPFLSKRIQSLPEVRVLIALGKIAHDSVLRLCGVKLSQFPFGHGSRYDLTLAEKPIALISSYHCSRYNTNTGRLTPDMFDQVFEMALTELRRSN